MPPSIYSTEPTWAVSVTSESIWDSAPKTIGSEAADALEVEVRIAARRGDGKSHPCLGRPFPTSSGRRRRYLAAILTALLFGMLVLRPTLFALAGLWLVGIAGSGLYF